MDVALYCNQIPTVRLLIEKKCRLIVKGSRLFHSIFQNASTDTLNLVHELQQNYWCDIANTIKDIKQIRSDTKCSDYLSEIDEGGHYDVLNEWYDGLCRVKFEDLMKVPGFVCVELDAAVKYGPEKHIWKDHCKVDTDEKRADLYYHCFCNT